MNAAIAQMQIKRQERAVIWQNTNGTFSHHLDSKREWADEQACLVDLKFHEEWR